MTQPTAVFSTTCHTCSRLGKFLEKVSSEYPAYYSKPVPSFGNIHPKLLIIGLAPGLHGANATGRPFTGDDGLRLKNCRITNAVRCLPPKNKPIAEEVNNCNRYLVDELKNVDKKGVILCLGQIAHKSTLKALRLKQSVYPFKHGKFHKLDDGRIIVDSYHCSRYNTQTKRLTETMFSDIFKKITKQLDG